MSKCNCDSATMCEACKLDPTHCCKNEGSVTPLKETRICGTCKNFLPTYTKSCCSGVCYKHGRSVDIFHSCTEYAIHD